MKPPIPYHLAFMLYRLSMDPSISSLDDSYSVFRRSFQDLFRLGLADRTQTRNITSYRISKKGKALLLKLNIIDTEGGAATSS